MTELATLEFNAGRRKDIMKATDKNDLCVVN